MTKSNDNLSRKKKKGMKKLEQLHKPKKMTAPEPQSIREDPVVNNTKEDFIDVVDTVEYNIPLREKFSLANAHGRSLALIVVAIVCCLVYSNSLQAPFVFDDMHNFVENPYTQIKEISGKNLWYAASRSPSRNRWLPNISFGLNYYFGERDPIGYHLVNIFIHLLTGLVLYSLALKTLSLPNMIRYDRFRHEIALSAASLWLLHPVQTNAVTYLVQRMTSMATLFCLLSLLLYAYGRTASSGKQLGYYLAAICVGFMALVSKENSYMLPVMIGGYEIFFSSAWSGFQDYYEEGRMDSGILRTFCDHCDVALGTRYFRFNIGWLPGEGFYPWRKVAYGNQSRSFLSDNSVLSNLV